MLLQCTANGLKEFHPINHKAVKIYTCGPTVYNKAHIGNYRSFITADLLKRALQFNGYKVEHTMNITDVGHPNNDHTLDGSNEDKIEIEAAKQKLTTIDLVRKNTIDFNIQSKYLNILPPTYQPKASHYVKEMLEMIMVLLDKNHAYIVDGEVYFDSTTYENIGFLSKKDLSKNIDGARVDINFKKRNQKDFALWKTVSDSRTTWDPKSLIPCSLSSKLKPGVPGWHIECSAMAKATLGDHIDIHTGGEDNIFPHHECETAQSECANCSKFVNYWIHTRHLLVDGKKMSKSKGTIINLTNILCMGYDTLDLRYMFITNRYNKPLNFNREGMEAAKTSRKKLIHFYNNLVNGKTRRSKEDSDLLLTGFTDSLNNNLNMSAAISHIFNFMKKPESSVDYGLEAIKRIDTVLGILHANI